MIRFSALLGLPLILTLAACAQVDQNAGPANSPDHGQERFRQRATTVAAAWRTAPGRQQWQSGFVPLQDPTVLPGDPKFSNETKQAFLAGWYTARTNLPTAKPADGRIRFPNGTLAVPLIGAEEAYRQLDQGDPPRCTETPAAPRTGGTGPDGTVSTPATIACTPLTVTGVKLGSVTVRTSRGDAEVPAWLFTVAELATPVARLAVASPAVAPMPSANVPPLESPDNLVAAQDLTKVDGAKLTYRLGVGACDQNLTPLVQEYEDLVVVAGSVTRSGGVCTEQLLVKPVTVTLGAPIGTRTVLDGLNGVPLRVTTAG
ncbi:hypothetical protein AB0J86_06665 [Micromonospora sp. NPDC049559]|uniref:hypothetical protein n=1 Tax=Micromonospora sp. NPDC049559 TaxID=3155923 RepID=UPI00344662BA